jgi:hypothetical protein
MKRIREEVKRLRGIARSRQQVCAPRTAAENCGGVILVFQNSNHTELQLHEDSYIGSTNGRDSVIDARCIVKEGNGR